MVLDTSTDDEDAFVDASSDSNPAAARRPAGRNSQRLRATRGRRQSYTEGNDSSSDDGAKQGTEGWPIR